MTTYNHVPIATGALANAATMNAPDGELDAAIGDLDSLTTTAKTSVVAALNEIDAQVGVVADDSVTFAKMQNIATDRLIGRDTAGSGNPEEIALSGGLGWTGSAGIQIADAGVTPAKLSQSLEAINLTPRWMSHSKYAWTWTPTEPLEEWYDADIPEGGLLLGTETILRRFLIGQVGDIGDALYLECTYQASSSVTLRVAITQRSETNAATANNFSDHTVNVRAQASQTATLVTGTVYVEISFQAIGGGCRLTNIRFGKNANSKSTWIDDPDSIDPALLLPGVAAKARMRLDINVLARGTSITEGSVMGGSATDAWLYQLLNTMENFYPNSDFVEINKGASSCTQIYDVIWNRLNNGPIAPDLFLLEVTHNDFQTPGTYDYMVYALDGLIQNTMQRNPNADVALTIMNPAYAFPSSTLWHDRTQAGRLMAQHYGLYLGDTLKETIKLAATGFDIGLLSEVTSGGSDEHPNLLGNDFITYCLQPMFLFGNTQGGSGQKRGSSALGPATNAYKYSRWYEANETDVLGTEFFRQTTGTWTDTAYTLNDALRPTVRRYSATTGNTLTFRYYGYGYHLLMEQGGTVGIATITTDGVADTYDGYAAGAITVHRTGRYVAKVNLALGWHVVTVAVSGAKNAASTGFEIGCAGAYVMGLPGYIVDDTSLAITYSGADWTTQASVNAYAGNFHLNPGTDTAQYVELDFLGTGIVLMYLRHTSLGICDVQVDGLDTGTNLDLYGATDLPHMEMVVSNLPYGRHTIRLRNTNTKNPSSSAYVIRIDGFLVLDERSYVGQVVQGVAGVGDTVKLVGYFAQYDTPTIRLTSEAVGNMRLSARPSFKGFTLAGDAAAKGLFEFAAM